MTENLIFPFIVALVLAFASIIFALIFVHFGKPETNSIPFYLMEKINHLKFSIGLFTSKLLDAYTDRMIKNQPIDNDRLLPGTGKNHTLAAIASMSVQRNDIPSVFSQVGDIFS